MQIKTVLFFIKDYKRYIIAISMTSILYAIFEGLNIAVLFPIINSVMSLDSAIGKESAPIQFLNRLIGLIPVKDAFIAVCIFVIILVLSKNIFRYLYMAVSSFAGYRIWNDVQKKLFLKHINADYRYFLDHKHGEIVYRLYGAPANVGGILQLIPQVLTELLKMLFVVAILFSMSFPITCAVIIIGGVFYFFTRSISQKTSYFLGKGRVEACEEQNILINEMINGIKQIKVFLGETIWVKRFNKAMDDYFKLAKKDALCVNMPVSALEIFALTALSISLIFLRKFSPQGLVSNFPLIGVFIYAFQRVMPSLSLITTLNMQVMGGLPVLEALKSAMDERTAYVADGARILNSFNDKIEFQNISFSYPARPEALHNVCISFEKNKCVAIVGPSGSGKTTIVNLLIRLFDPTHGCILVDGVDLREYKKDSWLNKIGFVSQDTFIFHASVRENITLGFEEAGRDRVVEAAMTANAHEFILKLPDGYDTIVGEKGMKLSGGERQRIAIARAVLRRPQILIFDEATSALDNVSQSLIQGAINKIVKDHTVILIAHRLSAIISADKIIVLDEGVTREMGMHSELIEKKGFYWRLYNMEERLVSVGESKQSLP